MSTQKTQWRVGLLCIYNLYFCYRKSYFMSEWVFMVRLDLLMEKVTSLDINLTEKATRCFAFTHNLKKNKTGSWFVFLCYAPSPALRCGMRGDTQVHWRCSLAGRCSCCSFKRKNPAAATERGVLEGQVDTAQRKVRKRSKFWGCVCFGRLVVADRMPWIVKCSDVFPGTLK